MTATNLYVPMLRARKLSAAVGSGKTRAAVEWIADPKNARRNVLYVAPTQALLDQTGRNLREAIAKAASPAVRNVHVIHSRTEGIAGGQVQSEVLRAAADAEEGDGQVQLITTPTFLAVVSKLRNPGAWDVILDESFEPATFTSFGLGMDPLKSWAQFGELFTVDAAQGHRIVPQPGRQGLVEELGRGILGTVGDRFAHLQPVAESVSNPAIRCELVMTDGAEALLAGQAPTKRKGKDDQERGYRLEFASYVDPQAFAGFREVLFLSALFEQTILYHLWTKALGVAFEEHPEFPAHLLRDTHAEQGRFLAVGHLLHKDDNASMENLQRNVLTGQPETRPGQRVVDHLIRTAAEEFGAEGFLLQVNDRYGYRDPKVAAHLLPRTARLIPVKAHGLNEFQDFDNVAALAVTNPNKQQLAWLRSRTGMSAREVTQAFRIHATYQALGRCSIRKAEATHTPKVALVVGADDARFLHDLFPGSHWLGQVGTLPSLSGLQQQAQTKEPGKAAALAEVIRRHLQAVPQGIDKIGSKTLKAAVEDGLRAHALLDAQGAGEYVGDIERSLWQRALSLACVLGQGWQRQGQSLLRVTAELYGFVNEAAEVDSP